MFSASVVEMYKWQYIVCVLTALIVGKLVTAEDEIADTMTEHAIQPLTPEREEPNPMTEKLAYLMDDFLVTADSIDRRQDDQVIPPFHLYQKMTDTLEDIIDLLDEPENAQYFLTAHGFDTIVANNLQIKYEPLRNHLLQLTKTLFDVAPDTTKTVIPSRILNDVLDIFENDEHVALKGKAIEVLSVWLPNNPSVQARVMKLKGLEPFYEQLSRLDKPMVGDILELFVKIVKEHEEARMKSLGKSKVDFVSQRLYQQIGLIERMSTPMVCDGLSNVFMEFGAASKVDKAVLPTVIELIRLVKPYCTAVYRGQEHVKSLLTRIVHFVEDTNNKEYFENLDMHPADLATFFNEFINELTVMPKEEL